MVGEHTLWPIQADLSRSASSPVADLGSMLGTTNDPNHELIYVQRLCLTKYTVVGSTMKADKWPPLPGGRFGQLYKAHIGLFIMHCEVEQAKRALNLAD